MDRDTGDDHETSIHNTEEGHQIIKEDSFVCLFFFKPAVMWE